MAGNNPYFKYKAAASVTMTPLELLVALYEKCIVECRKAADFIDSGHYVKANESVKRVEDIVDELRFALDMKYDVSQNLKELYLYYRQTLISANYKKDSEMIRTLIPQFQGLKEAFSQVQSLAS